MDIRLALMTGVDFPIDECQIIVHQPTIKEISMIGEQDFFVGVQTLCLHKSMFTQGKDDLENINNFQIFMTIMKEAETADKKIKVQKVLQLLFPKCTVSFTPNSLYLMEGDRIVNIDANNFEDFQIALRKIFCASNGPMDQQAFNPEGDKAREIAEKLMRGRKRVADQKGQSNSSVFSQYISVLSIGLNSFTIKDLINCSMFQLYDLMERYSLYVNWDIDIRSRLAGGKPDSQPDNWMKNIH